MNRRIGLLSAISVGVMLAGCASLDNESTVVAADGVRPVKLTPQGRATLRPLRKALMIPGPAREVLGGPLLAAEEAYANRAYPALDIPIEQTLAAQNAFTAVKARGIGQGKRIPGQWTMIGPSTANYPAVLSFSQHDYTTSGRITALAISPDCAVGARCRVWAAAAGGGIWRTDNALAGAGPSWTFISGSFASNAIGTLTYDVPTSTLYAGTGEPNASGDSEAGLGIYMSTDGGETWTR
jgi:hypothetical protein